MSRETRVREWMLERYLLDELPARERRRVRRELERDPELRSALEALQRSNEEILSAYPAERVVPRILERAHGAPAPAPRRPRLAWAAVPALTAAVLLLVLLPPALKRRGGGSEYAGVKGGAAAPALLVFRQGGDGVPLENGSMARAGDRLQLAYLPGKAAHGVILSIDGGGRVTLHFPEHEDGETALRLGGRTLLPRSFELDEAPRFERFFFVFADAPLAVADLLAGARALAAEGKRAMTAPLDLPRGCGQVSLLLRK